MHPSQRSELSLHLKSDEVFLHGTVNEAAGAIVRGTVILHVTEITKIKSISVIFHGKNSVYWSEGAGSAQRYYKEDRKIIKRFWSIMKPKGKAYIFTAGTFKWNFELPIPGDLPGTIDHELGEVAYQLKVVAKRPTFSCKYVATRNITITRLMLPSSLEHNQSVIVANEWPRKLSYNISLPRLIFRPGSQVPIAFEMEPLVNGLSIRTVVCAFEECTTLLCSTHTQSRTELLPVVHTTTKLSRVQNQWNSTRNFVLPKHSIRADAQSDLISISHKIRITVSLRNPDRSTSELRVNLPLVIASIAPDEEAEELPVYEDALKLPVYCPVGAMSPSQPSMYGTLPAIVNCIDEPLSFENDILARIPSYTTTAYSSPKPSLPAYDTIFLHDHCITH
ncbi:hypothetical protein BX666DRAFT_2022706 [Dichotomocladium elegans]|nr:hypothetical protein BX666DRAFT_2022706 [Dichotomocladium elegans]